MDDIMRPPPPMTWNGNISENWKKFTQRFNLYMEASEKSTKPEKTKISILLHIMGDEAIEVYNTFTFPTAADGSINTTLKAVQDKFEGYCTPRKNLTLERYNFNKICQQPEEPVEQFITKLRTQAKKCEYGDLEEDLITDRIVIGCRESVVRERMLREDALTLERATTLLKSAELVRSQAHQLSTDHGSNATVSKISRGRRPSSQHRDKHTVKMIADCYFCGGEHPRGSCPAYGTTCTQCGKKNHWKKQCGIARPRNSRPHSHARQPDPRKSRNAQRKVHNIQTASEDDVESLAVFAAKSSSGTKSRGRLRATLLVREPKATLAAQVDTGAETNLLPLRCFKKMYPNHVGPDGIPTSACPILKPRPLTTLSTYDGNQIRQYGTVTVPCSLKGESWNDLIFYVCESNGPIIIGLSDSRRLELISINLKHVEHITIAVTNASQPVVSPGVIPTTPIKDTRDLICQYPDRFEGQGRFPNKARIHLKEDAVPVVHARRKCPIHIKNDVNSSLDEMEAHGIIAKIPEGKPTEWLSSLAYARKANGKIRICLDPRDLNQNIKRTYHGSHTTEEITHKLAEARVFSKLDAKNGFWTMELDETSSFLTAFSSPASNQRYRFKRLPFGLCVSQDLFQEAMDKVTHGLEGVISIHDDINVFGTDEDDHDRNLHALMLRAREYGLVLNKEKTFIKVPYITFFGNMYGAEGVKPDPARTEQITKIPTPSTPRELQSFLGMVQYQAPFIPHLSDLTVPLRNLLKQEDFSWSATHQRAFDSIKDVITQATILNHFNPKLQTILQVDASKTGLGAALIQIDPAEPDKERVISFASKSLTTTEQRYANIEREYLAVVFGVEKFHTYTYGSNVIVQTDHSPLEKIHLKNLADVPPRLQRMKLRLQPYDITIHYRKGAEIKLADYLSRHAPAPDKGIINMDHTIHSIRWSDDKIQQLQKESRLDPTLSALANVVREGWPTKAADLPSELRPYWSMKDYVGLEDGILLKGQQIMIPNSLQQDVLKQLHDHCHQGIEKTRLLARKSVYWHNINGDIANQVGNCVACNTYMNSQKHEPMFERDIPSGPWEMLGSDIFELRAQKYLLLRDYYSKFFIVRKLSSESSSTIIKHLKVIFSEHGIPDTLYSDNGPCYNSEEFRAFSHKYGFTHKTSSPNYPCSNGFAERTVNTVKKTLLRCLASQEDPELAFLFLRTTPIASNLPSPAELLYERPLRSTLPSCFKFNMKHENTKEVLQQRQQTQKRYFDRGSQELADLRRGEAVMLQSQDTTWKPATVVSPTKEPRSYLVQTTDGGRYRRNRKFLRPMTRQLADKFAAQQAHDIDDADPPPPDVTAAKASKTVTFADASPTVEGTTTTAPSLRRSSRQTRAPNRLVDEI